MARGLIPYRENAREYSNRMPYGRLVLEAIEEMPLSTVPICPLGVGVRGAGVRPRGPSGLSLALAR